jgi:hypothetical protein
MKIKADDDFFFCVVIIGAFSAMVGLGFADKHGLGPGVAFGLFSFVVLLAWPAAKNLYQVWRASLSLRYTSSRDRLQIARDGAAQSRAGALPARRLAISQTDNGRLVP